MKQIYDFEQYEPPRLTENLLRAEAKRRELQKQAAMTAFSSLLIELCLILCTVLLAPESPILAGICAVYLLLSVMGSAMISVIFIRKRKELFL